MGGILTVSAPTLGSSCRSFAVAVAVTFALGPTGPAARAQDAGEPALKAAFVYNFAKFVEWPADVLPPARPLKICIAETGVADALEQIIAGRSIDRRPVVVARVTTRDALRACHIAYVGNPGAEEDAHLIAALGDAPVFSIGDSTGFIAGGGVARLFVEHGRMRFAINLEAAQRVRLRLSSHLLRLATIVKERHGG